MKWIMLFIPGTMCWLPVLFAMGSYQDAYIVDGWLLLLAMILGFALPFWGYWRAKNE